MIISPPGLFLFFFVLIQFYGVLQSNTLLLVLLLGLSIVQLLLLLPKLQWVKSLHSKLLALVKLPPTLFSDNLGASYPSANLVFHSRMKQLAINYHFVCYLVQPSELLVVHVSSNDQLDNALTKALSQYCLFSLCHKNRVISSATSLGAY